MITVPAWLPFVTVALACALGLALGWAGMERWKRKRVIRQRNNAIAEAARLRDQLGASRRLNTGGAYDPLAAFRLEQRMGLAVLSPESTVRIVDPT